MSNPTNTTDLRAAAQAVVDRWDTPTWKDVPATAEYINRLRAALITPQAQTATQGLQEAVDVVAYLIQNKQSDVRGVRLHVDQSCQDTRTQTFALMTVNQHGRIYSAVLAALASAPKAAPVAPAHAGEYPELPVPLVLESGYGPGDVPDAYTADQMHAYADATCAARGAAKLFTESQVQAMLQPARKPLTDRVLHALYEDAMTGHYTNALHYWRGTPAHRFARAIEQAHNIKAKNQESNK